MAIAFVRANIVGRSNGQSAVASAAYRSGERLHDDRYAKTHDYGRKGGIVAAGIEAPEGSPSWVFDREMLWNQVEAVERRKDSQLARELILALPHELDRANQVELARGFAAFLAAQGMGVDWAVHLPSKRGADTNVHAHLLCTTREITHDGFGGKEAGSRARSWNQDAWMDSTKRQYEAMANERLRARGYAPISFEERAGKGGEHLGPVATATKRREDAKLEKYEIELKKELNATLASIDHEIALLEKERQEVRPEVQKPVAAASPAPRPEVRPEVQKPAPAAPRQGGLTPDQLVAYLDRHQTKTGQGFSQTLLSQAEEFNTLTRARESKAITKQRYDEKIVRLDAQITSTKKAAEGVITRGLVASKVSEQEAPRMARDMLGEVLHRLGVYTIFDKIRADARKIEKLWGMER